MKLLKIKLMILLAGLFVVTSASALSTQDERQRIFKKADLIVEGYLYDTSNEVEHHIPAFVGENDQAVSLKVGNIEKMTFRVTKVYKGFLDDSALIKIYAYPKIQRDRSRLQASTDYILFLSKHPRKEGYQIMDYGRGKWLVFDYDGTKKVKAWHQSSALRPQDNYENYADLIQFLIEK